MYLKPYSVDFSGAHSGPPNLLVNVSRILTIPQFTGSNESFSLNIWFLSMLYTKNLHAEATSKKMTKQLLFKGYSKRS